MESCVVAGTRVKGKETGELTARLQHARYPAIVVELIGHVLEHFDGLRHVAHRGPKVRHALRQLGCAEQKGCERKPGIRTAGWARRVIPLTGLLPRVACALLLQLFPQPLQLARRILGKILGPSPITREGFHHAPAMAEGVQSPTVGRSHGALPARDRSSATSIQALMSAAASRP